MSDTNGYTRPLNRCFTDDFIKGDAAGFTEAQAHNLKVAKSWVDAQIDAKHTASDVMVRLAKIISRFDGASKTRGEDMSLSFDLVDEVLRERGIEEGLSKDQGALGIRLTALMHR